VTPDFYVAPQLRVEDAEAARELGVALVVNNRPDGEEPGQPTSADLREAAAAAGLAFVDIPVDGSGVSVEHLDRLDAALAATGSRPVLAFCRSGTRSITLWAFAEARRGAEADDVIAAARNAGYRLDQHRPTLQALKRASQ